MPTSSTRSLLGHETRRHGIYAALWVCLALALALPHFGPAQALQAVAVTIAVIAASFTARILSARSARSRRQAEQRAAAQAALTGQAMSAMESLARGIAARTDPDGSSPARVAALCCDLGQRQGLDSLALTELKLALLIRGTGSLLVSDGQAPSACTAGHQAERQRQWDRIVLRQARLPEPLISALDSCEERWDGEGGPEGLAGEDIPLVTRLLRIALLIESSWMQNPSPGHIEHQLLSAAGRSLDPQLVAGALEHLPDLLASLAEEADSPLVAALRAHEDAEEHERQRQLLSKLETLLRGRDVADGEVLNLLRREISGLVPLSGLALVQCQRDGRHHVTTSQGFSASRARAIVGAWQGEGRQPRGTFVDSVSGDDILLVGISAEENLSGLRQVRRVLAQALQALLVRSSVSTNPRLLSLTDPLTGLGNRAAFELALQDALANFERTGQPFALLTADLTGLESLNERHGHAAGDRALQALAQVLESVLRVDDVATRTGGRHFAAILRGCEPEGSNRVGQRLRTAAANTSCRLDDGSQLALDIACGVASWPQDAMSATNLREIAVQRLLLTQKSSDAA